MAMREQEGKLIINTPWGTEWRPFGLPRRRRPLKSVVLQSGIAEKIENDIRSFLSRRQWYVDRGVQSIFSVKLPGIKYQLRYSLPKRLPVIWTSRFRKNIFHTSPGRFFIL